MTDAEFKAIQKKCQKYIGIWKDRLWLQQWNIQPMYYRDGLDEEQLGFNPVMTCHPDWRYMQVIINVNARDIAAHSLSDEEIEKAIVHELCHCLLDEMNTEVPDENEERHRNHIERTVTVLMNVLYAAYGEAA